MTGTYYVTPGDRVVPHGTAAFGVFRDGGYEQRRDFEVLAASGDALVTLATQLDHLSERFEPDSPEYGELERTVRALLYLQQNYRLIKR